MDDPRPPVGLSPADAGLNSGAAIGWVLAAIVGAAGLAAIGPVAVRWVPPAWPVVVPVLGALGGLAVSGMRRPPRMAWHPGVHPPLIALGVVVGLASRVGTASPAGVAMEFGWIGMALLSIAALRTGGATGAAAGAAVLGVGAWILTGAVWRPGPAPATLAILMVAVAAPVAVAAATATRPLARRAVWVALALALGLMAAGELRAIVRPRPTATLRPEAPPRDRLDAAVGTRFLLGWQSLLIVRERPLFGVGPGGFVRTHPAVQARLFDQPRNAEWRRSWSRSATPGGDAFRIPAELGLVGLGLAGWLMAALARCAQAGWRRSRGASRVAVLSWMVAGGVLLLGMLVWSPLVVPATAVLAAAVTGALAASGGTVRGIVLPWPERQGWRVAAAALALLGVIRGLVGVARPAVARFEVSRGRNLAAGPARDLEGARDRLARAVRWDPADGEAMLALGTLEAGLGRWEEAAARFECARILLGDERVPYAAGVAALEAGDRVAARRLLGEALWLHPGHSAVLAALGELELRAGRRATAIGKLRQAVRADAGNLDARRRLGLLFYHDRNWREAIDMLMPVYAANPDDPHVATLLDNIRERRFGGKS